MLLLLALIFFVPHLSKAAQLQRLAVSKGIALRYGLLPDEIVPVNQPPQPVEMLPADAEEPVGYSWYQLQRMFPDTFFLQGLSDSKRIAFTFDDGPDIMYTPQVLDVLRELDVPATFFLIGWRSQAYPDVVKRILAEGHVIGNHSWSHPRLTEVIKEQLHDETTRTEDILWEITGRRTALMRPPYGAISKEVLAEMRSLGYKVINWSVDSVDWRDRTVGQVVANTLPDVQEGAIVLFHSAGGAGQSMAATVEALPFLIETLRNQGYTFVTVDELLGIPAYR